MLHRSVPLALATAMIWGTASPTFAAGQAAPLQYGVCASQFNLPTIYVSGVLQGPASSAASIRAGFTQFLGQRYGYKGGVGCAPAANAAAAEKLIQDRAGALRNAKKIVIETGWTESAMPAAKLAGALQGGGAAAASIPAAGSTSTATGTTGASRGGAATGSSGTGSGSASGSSQLASVLASIFGGGSSSAGSSSGSGGAGGGGSSGGGGSGGSGAMSQVSNALSSAFSKSASGGTSGHAPADGLGSAQAQNTRLVVYGCGRQDTQVACVTDLTNQNKADTLVHGADLWKDAFIVDDRGDRHPRSRGFFLNVDGDQRTQLDVSYGKSARFILMFDDVQSRVQKVSLRSPSGPLDVEDIVLITSGTASDASH